MATVVTVEAPAGPRCRTAKAEMWRESSRGSPPSRRNRKVPVGVWMLMRAPDPVRVSDRSAGLGPGPPGTTEGSRSVWPVVGSSHHSGIVAAAPRFDRVGHDRGPGEDPRLLAACADAPRCRRRRSGPSRWPLARCPPGRGAAAPRPERVGARTGPFGARPVARRYRSRVGHDTASVPQPGHRYAQPARMASRSGR